jgi:hypothetical protein
MMMEIKFPTASALQLREEKPGLWVAVKSDEYRSFGLSDVSTSSHQSSVDISEKLSSQRAAG